MYAAVRSVTASSRRPSRRAISLWGQAVGRSSQTAFASSFFEPYLLMNAMPTPTPTTPSPPTTSPIVRCADEGFDVASGAGAGSVGAGAGPSVAAAPAGCSSSVGTATFTLAPAATVTRLDHVFLPGAATATSCAPGSIGTGVPHDA